MLNRRVIWAARNALEKYNQDHFITLIYVSFSTLWLFLHFTDHHVRQKFFFTLKKAWYSVEDTSGCILILKCKKHMQVHTHTIYSCNMEIKALKVRKVISEESKLIQWYLGTHCYFILELVTSSETDKCPTMKHFIFRGGVLTQTSSSNCDASWASTECWNFFYGQNAMSIGFDECASQWVPNYDYSRENTFSFQLGWFACDVPLTWNVFSSTIIKCCSFCKTKIKLYKTVISILSSNDFQAPMLMSSSWKILNKYV